MRLRRSRLQGFSRGARSAFADLAPALESKLGERPERFRLLRRDEERGRARLAPGVEAVREALLRSDEGDRVDERVRNRCRGVPLQAVEVEVLDLAGRRLEAVAAGEVVVEVLAPRS